LRKTFCGACRVAGVCSWAGGERRRGNPSVSRYAAATSPERGGPAGQTPLTTGKYRAAKRRPYKTVNVGAAFCRPLLCAICPLLKEGRRMAKPCGGGLSWGGGERRRDKPSPSAPPRLPPPPQGEAWSYAKFSPKDQKTYTLALPKPSPAGEVAHGALFAPCDGEGLLRGLPPQQINKGGPRAAPTSVAF
jgi:hypothetical protein